MARGRAATPPQQQQQQQLQQAPRASSRGHARERGQDAPRRPPSAASKSKASASTELVSIQGRIAKLAALLRNYLETDALEDAAAREQIKRALAAATERVPSATVLKKEAIAAIVADKAYLDAHAETIRATSPKDLDWRKEDNIVRWIHLCGPHRVIPALKAMLGLQRQIEQRLGIRSVASSSSGHAPAAAAVVGAATTPARTPQRSQRQQQDQKTPPAGRALPAFAWSAFQNSPDPKSLPRPRRLGPKTPRSTKLGVPFPPAVSPSALRPAPRTDASLPQPPPVPPPRAWLST